MSSRYTFAFLAAAIGGAGVAQAQDPNVFPYSGRPADVQATIREYKEVPGEVPKPTTIVRLPDGKPDTRDSRERYLNPNHPGVQPRPDSTTYRGYTGVPNEKALPLVANVAPAPRAAGGRTGPKVAPPGTIGITYNLSPQGIYPKMDPFASPPGTNLLPTVYQDMRDGMGLTMKHTLPSTPREPYHLVEGTPRVTAIDPTSPTDDLQLLLERSYQLLTGTSFRRLWEDFDAAAYQDVVSAVKARGRSVRDNAGKLHFELRRAIDIIEGKPVPGRAYSGFPLLHHSGQNRITRVKPVLGPDGSVVGGHAEIRQVWYDQRIESDTMYLDFIGEYVDPKLPKIPGDVPWTITYTINVLNRGSDDFATTTMFFDSPAAAQRYKNATSGDPKADAQLKRQMENQFRKADRPARPAASGAGAPAAPSTELPPSTLPHVSMDQVFFPMETGTQTVLTVKMPPEQYYNLTYNWGWRVHPPRAQATENAQKHLPIPGSTNTIPIVQPEIAAFGSLANPIDALGDLAPAKRMWRSFRSALAALDADPRDDAAILDHLLNARDAFLDWKDRTHLPGGLRPDPQADLTLLYANNTIYGEATDGAFTQLPKWMIRPADVRVTLINADYFGHGYLNVDFGANRGWENQFKSSIQVAGSGSFFTFGRMHWRFNTNPGTISVAAAQAIKDGKPVREGELPDTIVPGVMRVWIRLDHDPGRRLRFYQFDPAHHDVAIYSIH